MMGFSSLMDTYLRLSKRSDEAWFPERHNPYSEFRQQVSGLVQDAKALLNDTMVNSPSLVCVVLQSSSHYAYCALENNSAIRG